MRSLLYILGPIAALVVALIVWLTVLPACDTAGFLGRLTSPDCPNPQTEARSAAEAEIQRGRELAAEIRRLERELAAKALCEAPPPDHAGTPLDRDRWLSGDIAQLEGCWQLVSDLAMPDPITGEVRIAQPWQVCFDGAGVGTQTMTFPGGQTCEGPMSAAFRDGGVLDLSTPTAPACSVGPAGPIMSGSCSPDGYGRVYCVLGDDAQNLDVALRRSE